MNPAPGALSSEFRISLILALLPAYNGIVHDIANLLQLPVLGFAELILQSVLIQQLGADIFTGVIVQESLDHTGFGIFRHELPAKPFSLRFHFRREIQGEVTAAVDLHHLCPELFYVGTGCGLVRKQVNLCLLPVQRDGQESPVAGSVQRQERKGVGGASEDTLPLPVFGELTTAKPNGQANAC